jgi:hypothetical protein
VVSVSDWLKVRSFRFESPATQNKKPKIILISKIYFKKFTVNKQRYFTMFTKLNRVLLASGLAVASAAMLSPAVFAVPTNTITAQVDPFRIVDWLYTAGTHHPIYRPSSYSVLSHVQRVSPPR